MPDLQTVISAFNDDPILTYSLLAAVFLAVVSLGSGWLRLDFMPLLRPAPLAKLGVAVVGAIGLTLLATYLNESLAERGGLPWLSSVSSDPEWPFGGLARLPLYIVTLAYGPSAGLVAGGLFAAFETRSLLPGWPEAVLTLELVILGWLSIYPSPRDHRWAGPLNAVIAYLLVWLTGGIAMVQAQFGEVTVAALWSQQQASLGGFALSALLLFLVPPRFYRNFFFRSRLIPRPQVERRRPGVFIVELFENSRRRDTLVLPPPDMPELSTRAQRLKRLEPPRLVEDSEH